MGVLETIHGRVVYGRRLDVLAAHFGAMLPRDAALLDVSVLDVGCGDGLLDRMLMNARPDLRIEGIDVLLRPHTHIPVTVYDGRRIPHPDNSFDAVTFVDVLHHTDDPAALLAEAGRVARRCVVIKDHTRDTALAGPVLRFMDWLGNERHGVRLPYNYWSSAQWSRAFRDLGWKVSEDRRDLHLYPAPADLLFGRGLHCLVRLDVADAARG